MALLENKQHSLQPLCFVIDTRCQQEMGSHIMFLHSDPITQQFVICVHVAVIVLAFHALAFHALAFHVLAFHVLAFHVLAFNVQQLNHNQNDILVRDHNAC